MLNFVDVEKGLLDASYKKRRHFILFLFVTILAIGLVLLFLLISDERYAFELVMCVFISIAYLFYLIFYFSIIQRCFNNELRLYEGAKNATFSNVDCEIISLSDEIKEYNGLEYYVLEAKVEENLKEENKIFYVNKKFDFKKNQKAKMKVYGSIVISMEFRK